jgi:hypothetical protein
MKPDNERDKGSRKAEKLFEFVDLSKRQESCDAVVALLLGSTIA